MGRAAQDTSKSLTRAPVDLLARGYSCRSPNEATENRISGFNWSLIGAALLVAYFVQRRKVSVLFTPRDSIVVLGGRAHDDVLAQIASRRKARFLQILERPDVAGDAAKRNGLIAT